MTNTVRFLHTADLHLDSPLRSLASRNSELRTVLEDSSRSMLRRLIDTAIEESVDALLIAGDLFDGNLKDVRTAKLLEKELRRLNSAEIPAFIIWGNHDAEARLVDILHLPENVHTFDGSGGYLPFADEQAFVHAVSFSKRKAPGSLLGKFGPPVSGAFNIGMLHTSLTGSDGHNNYAPCSVQELIDMGYDYWALGHIHKRQVHNVNPAIVMPGNPLGRHINEDGKRSISLVTLESGKDPAIREINIAPAQFQRIHFTLSQEESLRELIDAVLRSVEITQENSETEILIVRVILEGHSQLHRLLNRELESVLIDLREEYEHRNDIWIDSIDIKNVHAPVNTNELISNESNHDHFLNSLASTINEELVNSNELIISIQSDLDALARALPGELNNMFDDGTEDSRKKNVLALLDESKNWIMHQLETDDKADLEHDSQ